MEKNKLYQCRWTKLTFLCTVVAEDKHRPERKICTNPGPDFVSRDHANLYVTWPREIHHRNQMAKWWSHVTHPRLSGHKNTYNKFCAYNCSNIHNSIFPMVGKGEKHYVAYKGVSGTPWQNLKFQKQILSIRNCFILRMRNWLLHGTTDG